MLNIEISTDSIHIGERFAVAFQRTLRIPDDGRTYPLPPGFGRFLIDRGVDLAGRLLPAWQERGGVFIPKYQREALRLAFSAALWEPNVVIALFNDFGTGLYPHAPYMARQFKHERSPYAVHLGDVYYAGRESEFLDNFEPPSILFSTVSGCSYSMPIMKSWPALNCISTLSTGWVT